VDNLARQPWDIDVGTVGLGGWSPDVLHAYDPTSKILYHGDGEQQSAQEIAPSSRRSLEMDGSLPPILLQAYPPRSPRSAIRPRSRLGRTGASISSTEAATYSE
jgi:hypothetical protein